MQELKKMNNHLKISSQCSAEQVCAYTLTGLLEKVWHWWGQQYGITLPFRRITQRNTGEIHRSCCLWLCPKGRRECICYALSNPAKRVVTESHLEVRKQPKRCAVSQYVDDLLRDEMDSSYNHLKWEQSLKESPLTCPKSKTKHILEQDEHKCGLQGTFLFRVIGSPLSWSLPVRIWETSVWK